MAVLADSNRIEVRRELTGELSNNRVPINLTKAQIKAAVDAIDTWIDNNRTSFNNAIPEPAQSILTTTQKVRLFLFVLSKRFNLGL